MGFMAIGGTTTVRVYGKSNLSADLHEKGSALDKDRQILLRPQNVG
jgi:hypothetical protein